ncbi:hypothetical protein Tco_1401118 [Tanacetum coccineum]
MQAFIAVRLQGHLPCPTLVPEYLAFGRHLEEIHVTWAHLKKKRTRLRTNTKTQDLKSQRLETASPFIHDAVTLHLVTASQHFLMASARTTQLGSRRFYFMTVYGYFSIGRFDVFFRDQLLVFQQHQDESLYDSWTRFKGVIRKVPNHGLSIWTLIEIFLKHLELLSCHIINLTAEGDLRKFSDIGAWEVPSFDELKPQPLLYSPSLDVSLGDVIGPEPPIKPHSPDSSRMKVVDYLTTQIPPSPHMANSHPKGVYSYYNLGLESKEVSPIGEKLSLFDRPNEVERGRILEAHRLVSIIQQQISQRMAPSHHDGRKAHLLEDKQIPSVGVFDEVFSIWKAFGENTRDLGSFGEETDKITNQHQDSQDLKSQRLEPASPFIHDAITLHLVTASQHFLTTLARTDSTRI